MIYGSLSYDMNLKKILKDIGKNQLLCTERIIIILKEWVLRVIWGNKYTNCLVSLYYEAEPMFSICVFKPFQPTENTKCSMKFLT